MFWSILITVYTSSISIALWANSRFSGRIQVSNFMNRILNGTIENQVLGYLQDTASIKKPFWLTLYWDGICGFHSYCISIWYHWLCQTFNGNMISMSNLYRVFWYIINSHEQSLLKDIYLCHYLCVLVGLLAFCFWPGLPPHWALRTSLVKITLSRWKVRPYRRMGERSRFFLLYNLIISFTNKKRNMYDIDIYIYLTDKLVAC